jgi:signal transduction protein with GAF and PtsI domain
MTRAKDYFKTFCKISTAFGTAITKQGLLDLVVTSAIDTMDGKAACLFLKDWKQESFVPMAQKGLSEKYLHANPMKSQEVLHGLEESGFLAYEDAVSDPRLENHEQKRRKGSPPSSPFP